MYRDELRVTIISSNGIRVESLGKSNGVHFCSDQTNKQTLGSMYKMKTDQQFESDDKRLQFASRLLCK